MLDRDAEPEPSVPATCRAAFSELHHTTSEKLAINILSRWHEIMVHRTVDVKEFRKLFD
jgi:hypothetical protein